MRTYRNSAGKEVIDMSGKKDISKIAKEFGGGGWAEIITPPSPPTLPSVRKAQMEKVGKIAKLKEQAIEALIYGDNARLTVIRSELAGL